MALIRILAFGVLPLMAMSAAKAASYDLNFVDTTLGTDGTLVITTPAVGSPATAVSGNFGALTVTGLSGYDYADNTFTLTAPYVDLDGFAFKTSDGNAYNLYSLRGSDYLENYFTCPEGACDPGLNSPYDLVRISGVSSVMAPEIDPTSAATAFTLLLGAILVFRGRGAGADRENHLPKFV